MLCSKVETELRFDDRHFLFSFSFSSLIFILSTSTLSKSQQARCKSRLRYLTRSFLVSNISFVIILRRKSTTFQQTGHSFSKYHFICYCTTQSRTTSSKSNHVQHRRRGHRPPPRHHLRVHQQHCHCHQRVTNQ